MKLLKKPCQDNCTRFHRNTTVIQYKKCGPNSRYVSQKKEGRFNKNVSVFTDAKKNGIIFLYKITCPSSVTSILCQERGCVIHSVIHSVYIQLGGRAGTPAECFMAHSSSSQPHSSQASIHSKSIFK